MNKLFVDDWRQPPDSTWMVARSYGDAIEILGQGDVEWLSLDYDLEDEATGLDICEWIASTELWPRVIWVHSQHPDGRDLMVSLLKETAPDTVTIVD